MNISLRLVEGKNAYLVSFRGVNNGLQHNSISLILEILC